MAPTRVETWYDKYLKRGDRTRLLSEKEIVKVIELVTDHLDKSYAVDDIYEHQEYPLWQEAKIFTFNLADESVAHTRTRFVVGERKAQHYHFKGDLIQLAVAVSEDLHDARRLPLTYIPSSEQRASATASPPYETPNTAVVTISATSRIDDILLEQLFRERENDIKREGELATMKMQRLKELRAEVTAIRQGNHSDTACSRGLRTQALKE